MKLKRGHYSQLPSKKETEEMLALQSRRDVPKEKEKNHYPDFITVNSWLKEVKINTNLFTLKVPKEILKEAELVKPALIKKTLNGYKKVKLKEILRNAEGYLAEEDTVDNVDFIMIFGSKWPERAFKGAELYKKGYAKKIVIKGGHPHYRKERFPEAVDYSRILIGQGVPKDKILIEANSINFVDNVMTTFNLLDNFGVKYKKNYSCYNLVRTKKIMVSPK